MAETVDLQKLFNAVDKSLTEQKIKFKKDKENPFLWVISIPLQNGALELNIDLDIVDKKTGAMANLRSVFGDIPASPKEQWAMFLRLLQMNTMDTFEGRFAIDEITNELIFLIVHDTEILMSNITYFLGFIKHAYEELRPKAIGFIN
ncbi:type III secretion system chaperone [bacterium]|nr:type III secretion system chaperone [bacterium]